MRTLPNLGLQGFFDLGEDGWDDEMSLNLLKLSVLTQGGVLSKVSATPATPDPGDVHIFAGDHPTNPNDVAVFDGETGEEEWKYFTPAEGWLLYNRTEDYYEKFDGTEWAELATGGGGGSAEYPDFTDSAGKALVVNETEDGVEWAFIEGGSGGGGGGGGGDYADPVAAKYWRLIFPFDVEAYSGGMYIGFAEIQWKDGATIVSTGGMPTSSRDHDANWRAVEAFNGETGSSNDGWIAGTVAASGNQSIVYSTPAAVLPDRVTVFPISNYVTSFPKRVFVEFSVDAIHWKTVGYFDTDTPAANVGQTFLFADLEIPEGVTTGGGSGGGGGADGATPSWADGSGDRRFSMTATAAGGSAGDPNLSLGAGTVDNFYWNPDAAEKSLVFDFQTPNIVQGFAARQDQNTANGTWKIQGSNDGTSWTDLVTDFVWGGTPYAPRNAFNYVYAREFENDTPYRYYRLLLVSGATNNRWQNWFAFKSQPIG